MTDPKTVSDAAGFAARFNVSRETVTRLTTYQALLGKWQKAINLVGPATLDNFWHRHAADSAQILALAQVDVVTARALAPLDALAGFMAPFCNSSTIALLHKGRDWQDELTACRKNWNMVVETHESCTDAAARIVEISQLVRQPNADHPAAF